MKRIIAFIKGEWLLNTAMFIFLIFCGAVIYFNDPLKSELLPQCPVFYLTKLYCPGCGSTRATYNLLHLNFLKAADYNPLLMLFIPVFIYKYTVRSINAVFSKNIFDFTETYLFAKISIPLIILFTILRNIPVYPFSVLAP